MSNRERSEEEMADLDRALSILYKLEGEDEMIEKVMYLLWCIISRGWENQWE